MARAKAADAPEAEVAVQVAVQAAVAEPAKRGRKKPDPDPTTDGSNFDPAIVEALAGIKKAHGAGRVASVTMSAGLKIKRVPTGILALDYVFGGIVDKDTGEFMAGYPRGRTVLAKGWESSGKSCVMMLLIAAFQRTCRVCTKPLKKGCGCGAKARPMQVALFDAEGSYEPQYGASFGINNDNLLICTPASAEEGIDISRALILTGQLDLLCVDSLAGMTPQDEIDKSISDMNVAPLARLVNRALKIWQAAINDSGLADSDNRCSIFLINQIREKAGRVFGPSQTIPGGHGQRFASSVILHFDRAQYSYRDVAGKKIAQDKVPEGMPPSSVRISFSSEKNKTFPAKIGASFDLFFRATRHTDGRSFRQGATDELDQMMQLAQSTNVIENPGKGQWKFEEFEATNEDALRDMLAVPEVYARLKEKLLFELVTMSPEPELQIEPEA